MKSGRICWIDSRTIKRGRVLVLDGSLVPFCSKCIDACMRANDVLRKFEKRSKVCELTAQVRTFRLRGADGPPLYQRACLALVGVKIGWRTVRPGTVLAPVDAH